MTRHYFPISILVAALVAAAIYWRLRAPLHRLGRIGGAVAAAIVPRLLAVATFLAGTILLFSGATRPVGRRLFWLNHLLPLPILEASHFFGSIAGVALLILARGIQRRLDAAYQLTIIALAGGILFSLLKAFDYEEALFLGALLLLLIPSRRYFYRTASIIEERFTPTWIVAIAVIVLGSVLLGYVSFHLRPTEQFWQFEFDKTAPRFLRATAGVVVVLILFALARMFRPARPQLVHPTPEQLAAALPIAAASPDASAQLVALGDKAIFTGERRDAFIMYGTSGRSWITMGDPVGPVEAWPELAASFIDLAVRRGGWPVFYKVGGDTIGLYLDFGLSVVKLGEEARVLLDDFSLEGPARRNLRRVWRKAVDDGCTFELLEDAAAIAPVLPELRAVSDDWLHSKHTREKSFSLGHFRDDYVERYPVGIACRGGAIVAFANVWCSGAREELEVDLMRFSRTAPPGIMRYLLAELMLWGRVRGYHWFNLGMSPLSGLRRTTIAPLWYQVGLTLYGRGERFYNFQGIRSFKEWFHPQWEPKYLANPGGAIRPLVVANIAALIAGGYEGVLRK
ncbi:MAG TPA: bifunctional lysylphosphatidylglycerol flippase/synthetase MprF [Gemmatimonadaceae bacterium]|nr:bifunctional lysylphosphatidylglycerol flippase/synthetase MprF [Gemmatimonadaceae bacterium]